ncbi:hypothetical protein MMC10_004283 [Thelotrema lepadinum]|nr:hypothetical protein [Thelotrema lepadinum]
MSSAHPQAIIAANTVFLLISAASVAIRFYARRKSSARNAADDFLVVAAWCFSASLAITNIIGVPVGFFGEPFESLTEDQTVAFLKVFFATQFFYIFAVAFVKLSVLFLYRRIFSAGKTPVVIWVLVALTIGWIVSFFFATLFQIYPVWCNWEVCEPTANYPVMYVLSSVTDILLDVVILCLPVFFIRRLQMSTGKKIGITAIFGLGIFCIVASVARLVYTIQFDLVNISGELSTDFDVSVDNIILWSGIEACISTTCASLPCYGPLVVSGMRASSGQAPSSPNSSGGRSWLFNNYRNVSSPSVSKTSSRKRSAKAFWWDATRQNTLMGDVVLDTVVDKRISSEEKTPPTADESAV